MDWNRNLNQYCERIDYSVWAEPLNAFSNLSFIIAAAAVYHYGDRHQVHTKGSFFLVGLLILVGIGSFMFHTVTNVWGIYADLIPVFLFQMGYLTLYGAFLFRNLSLPNWLGGLITLMLFMGLSLFVHQFPLHWLNGAIIYLPAWLMLLLIGVYHSWHSQAERCVVIVALLIFAISLMFRSLDQPLCEQLPSGTHFIWHLLNGAVLYVLIRGYMNLASKLQKEAEEKDCDTYLRQ